MVVIVISGKPGSGSSTVARLLAKKLKLRHFSAGDYYKKNVAGSRSHSVKSLATKSGTDKKTHNAIDRMQVDIAKKGNVIIESKTGIHFVRNADFHVWLKADLKTVASRMSRQEKIPLKAAAKLIGKRDMNERKMFKRLYSFDTFSQEKRADLVINTSNKSPKEIVELIIKKVRSNGLVV